MKQTPPYSEYDLEILREIKQIISKGWQQGSARNNTDTKFCMWGALNKATGKIHKTDDSSSLYKLLRTTGPDLKYHNRSIPWQNDNVLCSQQDALRWINNAINVALEANKQFFSKGKNKHDNN